MQKAESSKTTGKQTPAQTAMQIAMETAGVRPGAVSGAEAKPNTTGAAAPQAEKPIEGGIDLGKEVSKSQPKTTGPRKPTFPSVMKSQASASKPEAKAGKQEKNPKPGSVERALDKLAKGESAGSDANKLPKQQSVAKKAAEAMASRRNQEIGEHTKSGQQSLIPEDIVDPSIVERVRALEESARAANGRLETVELDTDMAMQHSKDAEDLATAAVDIANSVRASLEKRHAATLPTWAKRSIQAGAVLSVLLGGVVFMKSRRERVVQNRERYAALSVPAPSEA